MILPIRTNIAPRRTPYANYVLIAVNVIIFLITYSEHATIVHGQLVKEVLRPWADKYMLDAARPKLWQFITYAFLHGGYLHIFFNMYFLYLFGNNVNDKLGTKGYLCFYFAGAVFSGIGHCLLSQAPVLGASGAVAAVTGAYLVLFPRTVLTVLYFFFFIGTIDVPALYFIALKLILIDNILVTSTQNVAYDAHLAGYAFGITTLLLLLGTGFLDRSGWDLWSVFRQWNRRRHYRDMVGGGYDPYTGRYARKIKSRQVSKSPAEQKHDKRVKELREQINRRVAERNLASAALSYLELMDVDSEQIPPRQHLLDIGNQLTSENKYEEAAGAYEKFLNFYSNYEHIEQVELMLGIIYSRYLGQTESAIKHLESAAEKLSDPDQRKMCNQELEKLRG